MLINELTVYFASLAYKFCFNVQVFNDHCMTWACCIFWQVIMNLCSVDQFSTLLWLWLCPDFNFNWMLIACEFWSMISWFTDYIWFYHLILNAATPNCVAKLLLCYMKWFSLLFVEIECTAFYFHPFILLLSLLFPANAHYGPVPSGGKSPPCE